MLLETYRECLRDFFDMPALRRRRSADIRSRQIRVATVDSDTPSPFAASLLFYLRRQLHLRRRRAAGGAARAGARGRSVRSCAELLGDAELRELLDAESMDGVERQLQRLLDVVSSRNRRCGARHAAVDSAILTETGVARTRPRRPPRWRWCNPRLLVRTPMRCTIRFAGEPRFIAVEDAARAPRRTRRPVAGQVLPESLLQPVADPDGRPGAALCAHARTVHRRRTSRTRYGLSAASAEALLLRLTGRRPAGRRRVPAGWNATRVDRRRRAADAAAALAGQAAPRSRAGRSVGPRPLRHHVAGIVKRRRVRDALLDAIEQLQGAPLFRRSILETEILRRGSTSTILRTSTRSRRLARWCGSAPSRSASTMAESRSTSRIMLRDCCRLARTTTQRESSDGEAAILDALHASVRVFLRAAARGTRRRLIRQKTVDALWSLVWRGLITNDTFHALRAFTRSQPSRRAARRLGTRLPRVSIAPASRRRSAGGRWALVNRRFATAGRDRHDEMGCGNHPAICSTGTAS